MVNEIVAVEITPKRTKGCGCCKASCVSGGVPCVPFFLQNSLVLSRYQSRENKLSPPGKDLHERKRARPWLAARGMGKNDTPTVSGPTAYSAPVDRDFPYVHRYSRKERTLLSQSQLNVRNKVKTTKVGLCAPAVEKMALVLLQ